MQKVKILTVLIFFILVQPVFVFAAGWESGGLPVGARYMAMGEAGVGFAPDANALYWNPAGLTQLQGQYITTMHQDKLQLDIPYDYVGFAKRKKGADSAYGFYLTRLDYTNALGYEWQEDVYNFCYAVSYTPELSIGINFKYLRGRIPVVAGGKAIGYGADVGLMYKVAEGIKAGVVVRDLYTQIDWTTGTSENPSRAISLGVSYRYDPMTTVVFDVHNIASDNETNKPLTLGIGIEKYLDETIAVRLGYIGSNQEGISGATVGVGIHLGPWQIDYAYDPTRAIENIKDAQRISFSYKLK